MGKLVARGNVDLVDAPMGTLIPTQNFCFIDGIPISRLFDPIMPHLPCPEVPIHCNAFIIESSIVTYIDGIPVARQEDRALCNHSIIVSQDFCFSD